MEFNISPVHFSILDFVLLSCIPDLKAVFVSFQMFPDVELVLLLEVGQRTRPGSFSQARPAPFPLTLILVVLREML